MANRHMLRFLNMLFLVLVVSLQVEFILGDYSYTFFLLTHKGLADHMKHYKIDLSILWLQLCISYQQWNNKIELADFNTRNMWMQPIPHDIHVQHNLMLRRMV